MLRPHTFALASICALGLVAGTAGTAGTMAGCGGSKSAEPLDGGNGGNGGVQVPSGGRPLPPLGDHIPVVSPRDARWLGAHDLRFDDVQVDGVPVTRGPSIGAKARFDIMWEHDAYHIGIYPIFGVAVGYFGELDGAKQTMKLTPVIDGPDVEWAVTDGSGVTLVDQFSGFVLTRGADGTIRFTGTGFETADPVTGKGAEVRATGTLIPDATVPSVRLGGSSDGPTDALFPWEYISVLGSEPLLDFPDAITVEGGVVDLFGLGPILPNDGYLGVIDARGTLRTDVLGPLVVHVNGRAHDPAGNAILPFSGSIKLVDPGPAIATHRFVGGVVPGFAYGKTSTDVPDAVCTTPGSCLLLGPAIDARFRSTRIGYAGRVHLGKPGKVRLRYRLLADSHSITGDAYTGQLRFEVMAKLDRGVTVPNRRISELTPLAAPVLGMDVAGEPTTLETRPIAAAGDYDFVVILGDQYTPIDQKQYPVIAVVIEEISAE